jgi:hypothetical protein
MPDLKAAAVLVGGFFAGVWLGTVVQSSVGAEDVPGERAREAAVAACSDPAVEAERSARRLAQMKRDSLREKLARAREKRGVDGAVASDAPAKKPRARARPAAPAPPPDPDVARLHELAGLGKSAFPAIARLLREGEKGPKAAALEAEFALLVGLNRELRLDALLSTDYPDEARFAAAECGASLHATGDEVAQLLAAARTEALEARRARLLHFVATADNPSLSALLDAAALVPAGGETDVGDEIVSALEMVEGSEAIAGLRSLAAGSSDPGIRRLARLASLRRDPPVAGFLLVSNSNVPDGEPLVTGDIVTSLDGDAVTRETDLEVEGDHTLAVWREGSVIPVRRRGKIEARGMIIALREDR